MGSQVRNAGLSAIELIFAIVIFGLSVAVPVQMTGRLGQAFESGSTIQELDQGGRRTLDRLTERLQGSAAANITPPGMVAPLNTSTIDFQQAIGLAGDDLVWANPERIRFEYSPTDANDGLDNDGNGLIDDGVIVWIQNADMADESRTVLCRGVMENLEGEIPNNNQDDNGNGLVDEAGLSFDLDGDWIRVWITIGKVGDGGIITLHTIERTIAFRNES